MTNNNDAHEEIQPEAVEELLEHTLTPGKILREAREAAGLSISQVADRLRLRQTLIKELESDEFSKHVSETYIRGYLRSYAKVLQVSESEVMLAYKTHFGDHRPAGSMQTFSNKKNIESQDNRLMILTWVIVLILIGSVAVFVWQQFSEDREQASSSSVSNSSTLLAEQSRDEVSYTASTPGVGTVPDVIVPDEAEELVAAADGEREMNAGIDAASETAAAETQNAPQRAVENDLVMSAASTPNGDRETSNNTTASGAGPSANQEPAAGQVPSATPEPSAAEEPVAATATNSNQNPATLGELVLVFSGDSWVRIEDANGEAIAYGVKVDGHVMPLDGQAPYSLVLGAPQSVAVYYQGNRIDMSEFRGGRIARFNLPRGE